MKMTMAPRMTAMDRPWSNGPSERRRQALSEHRIIAAGCVSPALAAVDHIERGEALLDALLLVAKQDLLQSHSCRPSARRSRLPSRRATWPNPGCGRPAN